MVQCKRKEAQNTQMGTKQNFHDLSVYSKRTHNDLIPQLNSFWHAYKRNGVDKLILAWVSGHPLRAISLSMLGRA